MIKVITYGTYDLLHRGHIRLLERAKALGDYLIVGVTADDFDKTRGKINVQQTLNQRIEAVRTTGLADEIIVEEYEGQKIDDIRKYNVDIFTVGSDWKGTFDYLNEYCKVIYLDRTEGISSSEIRKKNQSLRLGLVGHSSYLNKIERESHYVNGITISGICTNNTKRLSEEIISLPLVTDDYEMLLENCDAVYIHSVPQNHAHLIRKALEKKKHVLCESPIALFLKEAEELFQLAKKNNCILMDALRTAYSTAYYRLRLLLKSGIIGNVISVDATCTSLVEIKNVDIEEIWNSMSAWGPTALLPIFQVLGTEYKHLSFVSHYENKEKRWDSFSQISLTFDKAVATAKIGNGVKSESELVISGTKGYVYVPAPWWKMDYFEIRFENPTENKRYFYQLDGEGIRNELSDFAKSVFNPHESFYIEKNISKAIIKVMENFYNEKNIVSI